MHSLLATFAAAFERAFVRTQLPSSTAANQIPDTGITKIRLAKVNELQDGKRAWEVEVSHNDGEGSSVSLLDPLEAKDYTDCFKFFADESFEPGKHGRSKSINEQMLKKAGQNIPDYGAQLLGALGLDRSTYRERKRDILVIEDSSLHKDDERSLHNLVWELLEDPIHWKQTNPSRISVTRVITPSGPDSGKESTAKQLGQLVPNTTHQPIRMLLVIGRSLAKKAVSETDWKYEKEKISPSLIQHSIMQTMRHLEDIGHPQKVNLEILRPATFSELQRYLGIDTAQPEQFDIIHLDMHGEMMPSLLEPNGPPFPHLAFTEIKKGPPAHILATEVAEALRGRTKLLVMNACNSSSLTGELGIRMVRTFLQEEMGAISATSYRLQETAAKIYYPVFYMSLLLYGSFNRAAADARHALRKDKRRHAGKERDDHYVQWNWSSTPDLVADVKPVRSTWLHFRMFIELLPCIISWIVAHACVVKARKEAWQTNHALDYPMYAIHRDFDKVECHVRCAEQLDIPSLTLYNLELEYWLKHNEKHSVYLHPQHPNSDPGLDSIRSLVQNTVRIWVETNFVSEVRKLNIREMLKGEYKPWSKPTRFWSESNYRDSMLEADWTWRCEKNCNLKEPDVKCMLIIDGFELLAGQRHPRRNTVLQQLQKIAVEMNTASNDNMYVITIGGLLEDDWNEVSSDFDLKVLGQKWVKAEVVKLPLRSNPAVSTFTRKRRPDTKARDEHV
jgi:hypothetical protein